MTLTKPIGYFISDQKDVDTIAEIAITYGDRLEMLDPIQKTSLLVEIANALLERAELNNEYINPAPNWLLDQNDTLSNDTLLALITATVEQLRHG